MAAPPAFTPVTTELISAIALFLFQRHWTVKFFTKCEKGIKFQAKDACESKTRREKTHQEGERLREVSFG